MPPEARTAAINQLKGLLVTAPASLREALEGRSTAALAAACARLRPEETALADPVDATKAALRVVACRIHQLDEEIGVADQRLATLVGRAAPRLLKLHAIGVDHAGELLTTTGQRPERLRNEAAFAHLCGVAPIPASSGKTHRHRLHRGGDRDANRALHLAVGVRMRWCPRTRAYAERRTKQGLSKPEIMRCVKRYLAREVYHAWSPTSRHSTGLDPPSRRWRRRSGWSCAQSMCAIPASLSARSRPSRAPRTAA